MDTVNDNTLYEMKIIKKGQTNPITLHTQNRAFERIKFTCSKLGIVVS